MTDPGTGGAPAGGPPAPAAPAAPAPRTFTQDELNAIAAREKDSGKGAGRKERDTELATQLGVPVEQLDAKLTEMREAADATKSDAVKAREAADREKAAAEAEKSSAASERHALRVERALLRAGVPADDADLLSDVVTLVRVDAAADDKALADAIEAVKGRHPAVFAAAPKAKPQFGTPPDVRPPSGRSGPPADGRDPQVERQLARRGINTAAKAS